MTNFSIIAINILGKNAKSIKKVLKGGWYFFNQSYKFENDKLKLSESYQLSENFFGKHININAIVGKNGSGKSSLLELFFRMMYNLSVKMDLLTSFDGRDKPTFIELNAELYFVANGNFYGLKNEGKSVYIFKQKLTKHFELSTKDINWGYEITKDDFKKLQNFFYSIVVNYSMQAYISNDYNDNKTKYAWIDYLFHKNDGYTVPMVLNPKRDYGQVDMNNEYGLAKQRLSALLIDNHQFIEGYEFKSILLKENLSKIKGLFEKLPIADDSISFPNPYILPTIKDKFLSCFGIESSKTPSGNLEYFDRACEYLILKSISIATRYKNFGKYNLNVKNVSDNTIGELLSKSASKYNTKIEALVTGILNDTSHITLKVKQVLNYIEYIQDKNNNVKQIKYDYLLNNKSFKKDVRLSMLDQILVALPPPFYEFEIQFNNNITLAKMSSGERQFLFSMSTVLYHIKNLISVPKKDETRIKYKNFNIILDEIELCFHPEYQREFVSKLLGYLTRMIENKENYFFNIIIATHSPFILSDIPNCNIMYLERNKNQLDNKEFDETFSANINDILRQSFFLENGFIGKYAQKRINSLLDYLDDKNKEWNEISAKRFIDLIGEPIIKQELLALYYDKFEDTAEKITRLKREIKELEGRK